MQSPFENVGELLNYLGIPLCNNDGQFRKTYDVLKDLAEIWNDLDKWQQECYAQALFKLFKQNKDCKE